MGIIKKIILGKYFLLFLTLFLGFFFRFYGMNWDQNQHLHPDERFLTMVVSALKWPSSLSEYLDTNTSPLNPANANFSFFVYGTLPLFIVKYFSELFKMSDYNGITIAGRYISAFFDGLTIVLVYKIAGLLTNKQPTTNNTLITLRTSNQQKITDNRQLTTDNSFLPLLAALFYALAVLPIQLSHYFAVDTFLVFFSTFSLYLGLRFIENQRVFYALLSGIMLGCATASKISALFFLPFVLLAFAISFIRHKKSKKNVVNLFISVFIFLLTAGVVFRLANPYAFASNNFLDLKINSLFVNNLKQLKSWDNKDTAFAPGLQWVPTKPVIYSFSKIIYYGLGFPVGILAFLGTFTALFSILKKTITEKKVIDSLPLLIIWGLTVSFFLYQSTQFVKAMRYFAFIYPFFAIFAGYAFFQITNKYLFKLNKLSTILFLVTSFIWTFMFVNIYSSDHSRIQASKWIYQNIPRNSTIACEHWDDCIPLSIPDFSPLPQYNILQLTMYDPDSKEKWQKVQEVLDQTDYIILTSSRLYGSIMSVPEKYPQTYKYYEDLFSGNLGFAKVVEFTSRPNLPIPFVKWCVNMPFEDYGSVAKASQECNETGISIVDDYTDESFTVYDHPKVIIFKKTVE